MTATITPITSTPAVPAARRWERYRAAVATIHAAYNAAVIAATAIPPTPGDARVLTEDEQDAAQAASWAAQVAAIVAAQQVRDTAIAVAAERWISPQSYCIVSNGDGLSSWSTTFAEPPTSDRPGHWTGTGPDGLPSRHYGNPDHAPVVEHTPVTAAPRYRRGQRVTDTTPGYTGRGDIVGIRWTPDGWYYLLRERGLWTYPSDVHWAYEGSLEGAA